MGNKRTINRNVWIGLVLVLFSAFFIGQAQDLGIAKRYPTVILGILGGLSLLLVIQGIHHSMHPEAIKEKHAEINWNTTKLPIVTFLSLVIYLALFKVAGFFISTAIFVPIIMYLFGERKPLPMICTITGLEIFVYVVFVLILNVNFDMV